MPIPTYERFIEPILRYLASQPQGATARDVHAAAATALGLTPEERAELLPSGQQATYKNRSGWAHDRLKRAGLSASPQRGRWQLTEAGLAFLREHPSSLTADVVQRLASGFENLSRRTTLDGDGSPGEEVAGLAVPVASPDDRLGSALMEIREKVAGDLLESILAGTPEFFERLVLDLLHAMGYGADRSAVQHIGRPNDGGLDGVISLDKLGLEKVYVQAKKWQGPVGRPELQAFYGALAGQHAKKGVMITTSSFGPNAWEFARAVDGLVLIDGKRLAQLMIDHEVGVSLRKVNVPSLDSDYFEG